MRLNLMHGYQLIMSKKPLLLQQIAVNFEFSAENGCL